MKKHSIPTHTHDIHSIDTFIEKLRQGNEFSKSPSIYMPPIPFWIVCRDPSAAEIGTAFLPVSGQIPFLMIFVEDIRLDELGRPADVTLLIEMDFFNGTGYKRIVKLNKGYTKIADEIRILEGARIVLTVSNPADVKGIWFSALFDVEISKTSKYQVVMDDLISYTEGKE